MVAFRVLRLCCFWCWLCYVIVKTPKPPKRTKQERKLLRLMKSEQKLRDANTKRWVGYVQESTAQINLLLPMIQKSLIHSTGYKLDLRSAIGLVKTDLIEMCAMQKDGTKALTGAKMNAAAGVATSALKAAMKSIRPKMTLKTDFALLKEGKSPIVEFSIDFVFLGGGEGDDGDDDDAGDDAFESLMSGVGGLSVASKMARTLILAQLKPMLVPVVSKFGMSVEDALAALGTVDSFDELQQALIENPEALLAKLAAATSGPTAMKIALARLKSSRALEPVLEKRGLVWDDVQPVLEDSIEELQAAIQDPEAFIESLVQSVAPAAAKLTFRMAMKAVIQRLQPVLEPMLKAKQLVWADVLPALEMIDTLDELEEACDDPKAFLAKLASESVGPIAKKMALARVRPKLEPKLKERKLEWADVLPVLEAVDSVKTIIEAMEDPDTFITKLLTDAGGTVAKKMAIARLRPMLEPKLAQQGLEWADTLPSVEMLTTLEELQLAIEDPDAFVKRLTASSESAAKKMAKNQVVKKTKSNFKLDAADVPPQFKPLYELFFDTSSKQNIVSIFKELAKDFVEVVTHSCKLIYQIVNLVRKCLPPFPIVTDVSRDIGMMIMQLDFKLRSLPFKLAKSLRQILLIPRDMLRFAGSVNMLFKVLGAALSKKAPALTPPQLTKRGSDGGMSDNDDDDELQPTAGQDSSAGILGAELAAAAGEAKVAAEEAEAIPNEPPPGTVISIDDEDGVTMADEEEEPEDAEDDDESERRTEVTPWPQMMERGGTAGHEEKELSILIDQGRGKKGRFASQRM